MSLLVMGLLPALAFVQAPKDTSRAKQPESLQEITVTAAPALRAVTSTTVSVAPAALKRAPALNPYDLLRQAAGLEVHDQGQGPGFASDVSIRGFSSDHSTDVALWIDGVPINEPVNGHAEGYNDWSLLFPAAIRSIEIFKGPTNPLYGNFAMAGVVNVRTMERMRGSLATLQGGAYGRLDGTVLTGFDRGTAGGVFGIRGMREDGWRPNSGYQTGQAHGRLVKDLSGRVSLDAGVELYAAGWDSPGFLTTGQFDAGDYGHVSDRTDGGFKHRAQERASVRVFTGQSSLWRSTVYATQSRWQLFLTTPPEGGTTEGSGSQLEEEDRRYGLGATTAWSWFDAGTELTIGAEARFDHSDYENWFTTARRRDSSQALVGGRQTSGALFVQGVRHLGRLELDLGGRFDRLDARSLPGDGSASVSDSRGLVSPKLGAGLDLGKGIGMFGNVSRGFRQTDGVIADPTLPFITAWAYEGGFKARSRRVTGSLSVFRMDVSNEQTFDPITARSVSGGASRRQGVDLDLRLDLGAGTSVDGHWTLNDAKYRRLVTEAGDTLSGARVFNTAKYVGSVAVTVAPKLAGWEATLGTNVVGPYTPFDAVGETLPAYLLLHLSSRFRVGRSFLSLGIRNLGNHRYPELRAGDFTVPGQPRSVYGSVELPW